MRTCSPLLCQGTGRRISIGISIVSLMSGVAVKAGQKRRDSGSSVPLESREHSTSLYDSLVASTIFYGIVCCIGCISAAGRRRLDKLIKKASSILDPVQVVGESRMMDKLSSLLVKEFPPLQVTITALGSSFSNRLIKPKCVKERSHRSSLLLSDCTTSTASSSIHLVNTHIYLFFCKFTATLFCFGFFFCNLCTLNILLFFKYFGPFGAVANKFSRLWDKKGKLVLILILNFVNCCHQPSQSILPEVLAGSMLQPGVSLAYCYCFSDILTSIC